MGAAGELMEWEFATEDSPFFEVNPEDQGSVLGAGAFGAVFAATWHGLPAAAKTLHAFQNPLMYGLVGPNADPAAAQAVLREFNAEAEALARVRHPNVLRFFGVGYAGAPAMPRWIVTERQPQSLHAFIRAPGIQGALDLGGVLLLCLDIADGLAYLHGLGMVHRDLKPKNVLVGGGGAKLADLGTAKMIGIAARTAQHTVGPGTAVYHPREVLEGRYTSAIDVFSLGLTVTEVVLAESPKRDGAHAPVDADQLQRALRAHPALQPVVDGCLQFERPRERISSTRAVELLTAATKSCIAAAEEGAAHGAAEGGRVGGEGEWEARALRGAQRALIEDVTRRRRTMVCGQMQAAQVTRMVAEKQRRRQEAAEATAEDEREKRRREGLVAQLRSDLGDLEVAKSRAEEAAQLASERQRAAEEEMESRKQRRMQRAELAESVAAAAKAEAKRAKAEAARADAKAKAEAARAAKAKVVAAQAIRDLQLQLGAVREQLRESEMARVAAEAALAEQRSLQQSQGALANAARPGDNHRVLKTPELEPEPAQTLHVPEPEPVAEPVPEFEFTHQEEARAAVEEQRQEEQAIELESAAEPVAEPAPQPEPEQQSSPPPDLDLTALAAIVRQELLQNPAVGAKKMTTLAKGCGLRTVTTKSVREALSLVRVSLAAEAARVRASLDAEAARVRACSDAYAGDSDKVGRLLGVGADI